ncbi:MAG: Hsp20/alpha crystallin family protein [Patescibacteria group bacterium]
MPKDRRSFFERLTGSVSTNDFYEEDELEEEEIPRAHLAASTTKLRPHRIPTQQKEDAQNLLGESEEEGQLTIDLFQTENEIIVQSTVAGVRPDDLDVSITRDAITIRGKREQAREVERNDYFYQELYWGTFSRSIVLPQEIDVDGAEATIRQGLLTLRLPKLDKNRIERVKVKHE